MNVVKAHVYNEKGNCIRGARAALKNPKAVAGTDFRLNTVEGGFTWSMMEKPKKAAPIPRKPPGSPRPPIFGQAQARKAMGLCGQPGGITPPALAKALDITVHTGRGLISRINKALREAGLTEITKGRAFKLVTYVLPPEAAAAAIAYLVAKLAAEAAAAQAPVTAEAA